MIQNSKRYHFSKFDRHILLRISTSSILIFDFDFDELFLNRLLICVSPNASSADKEGLKKLKEAKKDEEKAADGATSLKKKIIYDLTLID